MHLPDDFLNSGTAGSLMATSVAAVGFAVSKVRSAFMEKVPVLKTRLASFPNLGGGGEISFQSRLTKYGREKIGKMATVASLVFILQMLDFPVGLGASGHILGGALVAFILGPMEALLVMTAILVIQAVALGDGGVLALGANIFNMGIVGAVGGYWYFRFLTKGKKDLKKKFLQNAFIASWLSVIFASVAYAFEIALSGRQSLEAIFSSMVGTHLIVGFVEAIFTVIVLSILAKINFKLAILEK